MCRVTEQIRVELLLSMGKILGEEDYIKYSKNLVELLDCKENIAILQEKENKLTAELENII